MLKASKAAMKKAENIGYKGDTIDIKLEKKDTNINLKIRTELEYNPREEQQSTTSDVSKEGNENLTETGNR